MSPSSSDKVIRHRACSLKDSAHAIFAAELDPEFDRMCEDIKEARRKRGEEIRQSTKLKSDNAAPFNLKTAVSLILCSIPAAAADQLHSQQ